MSFWDKMVQGVNKIANDAAVKKEVEVKKAASEVANQLDEKKEDKPSEKKTPVRPSEVTKGRLERPTHEKDRGTFSTSARKRRANDMAREVIERAEEEERREDELAAETGLRPQVRDKTSDDLDKWYVESMRIASSESPGDVTGKDRRRRMREVDEEYDRKKEELAKKSEPDDRKIVYDEPSGSFVDKDKLEGLESGRISYDEDLARRREAGEDMWKPDYGSMRSTDDGRLMDGYAYDEKGDIALYDYAMGNRPIDESFAGALTGGAQEGILQIEHRINDARDYFARQNEDFRWETSLGDYVDHDDVAKALEDGEWLERFRNADKEITPVKPIDKGSIVGSYSGGTWYTYALDDEGNRIQRTDDNGQPMFSDDGSEMWEMTAVGGFDGDSEYDENGVPIPNGTYDPKLDAFVLEDGTQIPVTHYDDGGYAPEMFANWDIEAKDPDSAIRWETYHDNLVIPAADGSKLGDTEVSPASALEIINGTAERKNKDNGFLGILTPKEEYERAVSDAIEEGGVLGWLSTLPEYGVPQIVDAALASVPYMIPGYGALNVANNVGQSFKGVDPSTYDYETHTFEDPGTMSMDQYVGNIVGNSVDFGLDYMIGVPKAIRAGMPTNVEKSMRKYKKRADRSFLRNVAGDIAKTAGEEMLAEGAPELVSTLDRGDWLGTYFANPKLDADGNPVLTPAGDVVYDTETPFIDRFGNGVDSFVPSAVMGGALGVAMGGPANARNAVDEYVMRKVLGANRPIDIEMELTDEELAKINREAERVSYGE